MPTQLKVGPMPLHRQLFLVLRDQIGRGALPPGAALPPEHALCDQYGVSRITVRRALQDLAGEGYVERRHGRGTFVRERPPGPARAPIAVTDLDALRKARIETTVEVLDLGVRRPPADVAAALGLGADSAGAAGGAGGAGGAGEALYVLRVRRDRGEPLMVTEAWLPARFAGTVTKERLEHDALFEILQQAGVAFGRIAQEVTAEIASPVRAQQLGTDIGAAVLRIDRLVHDGAGAPVQHLSLFVAPERSRIVMDIAADQLDTALSGFVAHDVPRGRGRRGRR